MRLQDAYDVPVPIEAVFRFMTDPSRWPMERHAPGVTVDPARPLLTGDVGKIAGRGIKRPWVFEVLEVLPTRSITMRLTEEGRPRRFVVGTLRLAPTSDTRTRVYMSMDLVWGWPVELAGFVGRPLMTWMSRRGSRKQVDMIVEQYELGELAEDRPADALPS